MTAQNPLSEKLTEMLRNVDGVTDAYMGGGMLVVQVEAAKFTNEWSYSHWGPKGRLAQPIIVRIDDMAVIEHVHAALDTLYPRTFARLEWDTTVEGDLATLAIRTTLKRALFYPAKTCPRCKGEGDYSYNDEDGSICYGCGGVKRVPLIYKFDTVSSLRDLRMEDGPVKFKWAFYEAQPGGSILRLGDGATGHIDSKGNLAMDDPSEQLTPLLASLEDVLAYEQETTGRKPRRSVPMPREMRQRR